MNSKTGYIYQLISNTTNYSYIGYTSNINSCKYNHKINVFNGKSGILYDYIRCNGGWTDFTFRILDEIQFVNIQELKNKYIYYINLLKPELNNVTFITNNDNIIELSGDICLHNMNYIRCKICKWNVECRHNVLMKICNICTNEKKICEHNLTKRNCKACNSGKICIHNKFTYRCYYCKK